MTTASNAGGTELVLAIALATMLVVAFSASRATEAFKTAEAVGIPVPNPSAVQRQVHEKASVLLDTVNWLGCMPVVSVVEFLKSEIAKQNITKVHCKVIYAKIAELKKMYDARINNANVSNATRTKLRNYLSKLMAAVEAVVGPVCAATQTGDQPFFVDVSELLVALSKVQAAYCPSTIGSGSHRYSFDNMKMALPNFQFPLTVIGTVTNVAGVTTSAPAKAAKGKAVIKAAANPRDPRHTITFSVMVRGKPAVVVYKHAPGIVVNAAVKEVRVGDRLVLKLTPDAQRRVRALLPLESQVVAAVTKVESVPGKPAKRRLTVSYVHGMPQLGDDRKYTSHVVVNAPDAGSKQIALHVNNASSAAVGVVVRDTLVRSTAGEWAFAKYGVAKPAPKIAATLKKQYTLVVHPNTNVIRSVFA